MTAGSIPANQILGRAALNWWLIREQVRSVPGVRDVAFTNALPMQGWGDGMPFLVAGRETVDMAHRPACFYKRISVPTSTRCRFI